MHKDALKDDVLLRSGGEVTGNPFQLFVSKRDFDCFLNEKLKGLVIASDLLL